MLITRWQAPIVPQIEQIKRMYEAEGLAPSLKEFEPDATINGQRHPFDEVITVAQGELHIDIAGNKFLLRPGDRVMIPSNTKYNFKVGASGQCRIMRASKSI